MSQHFYPAMHASGPVSVLMGYDRQLDGFFMVIESEEDPDFCLYSNLEDRALAGRMGFANTPEYFLAKLQQLGIPSHANVIEEIKADQRGNVGNRYQVYDAAGQVADVK